MSVRPEGIERIVAADIAALLPALDPSGEHPVHRRFAGAALVADVADFTQLALDLEARSRGRGGDELAAVMTAALDEALAVVDAHGGFIGGLVGDAIHAVWLDEGQGPAFCRERALAASRAILAINGAGRSGGVAWRVEVAEGVLDCGLVGGVGGRWDAFVWGSALARATMPSAAAPEPDNPVASFAYSGEAAGATVVLEVLLPAVLRGKSAAELATWASELRVVTVVFCRIGTAGTVVDFEDLHQRVRRAQTVAATHEGAYDKVTADEKGVFVILAFGLPGHPVDGAAERALAAAAALRAEMPDCSVGVATGRVYFGIVGRKRRGQYTLYGPAAIVAARLMTAAPRGGVYCDETTWRSARLAAGVAATEVVLKGFGAIPAYVLSLAGNVEIRAPDDPRRPIVGRERERAIVAAHACDRAGGLLLISGEAGLGKSALLAYGIAEARAAGRTVLRSATPSYIAREALAACRTPARVLLARRAARKGQSTTQLLVDLASALALPAERLAFANPLFGENFEETAWLAGLPEDDRAQMARTTQARLLMALAGPDVLLAIDDADRIDEASMALADAMCALDGNVGLIAAARDPSARNLRWLIGRIEAPATTLPLQPLDRAEMAALVGAVLPVEPAHPLTDWTQERCEGNPRLALELLDALPRDVLTQAIVSRGAWREAQAALRLADMPSTLEAAIMARVAREPAECQTVLKAASVIGHRFEAEALAELELPLSRERIEAALGALARRGLLVETQGRYDFVQSLVRDTLHASLPAELCHSLHRRAAQGLEARRRFDRSSDLARHWRQAQRPNAAFRYARRAGLKAAAAGAHGDAAGHFRECAELDREGALRGPVAHLRRARLFSDLTDALASVNESDAAIEAGRLALAPFFELPPPGPKGWPGYAARAMSSLTIALLSRKPRKASRRRRYEAEVQVRTGYKLSDLVLFRYGILASCAMAARSAQAAEAVNDRARAARAYALLAFVAGLVRLPVAPRFLLRRPLPQALARRDWVALHFLRGSEVWLAMSLGKLREARRIQRRLDPYQARVKGDQGGRIHVAFAGALNFLLGDLEQAERSVAELTRLAAAAGDDRHQAWADTLSGRLALARADAAGAETHFARAERLYGRARDEPGRVHIGAMLALARARQGRCAEIAPHAATIVADVSNRLAWMNYTWDGPAAAAETMLRLQVWRPDRAFEPLVAAALAAAAGYARVYPVGRPGHALQRAHREVLAGRPERAARWWRKGAAEAARMGMVYEEWAHRVALADCESVAERERQSCRARGEALHLLLKLPEPRAFPL